MASNADFTALVNNTTTSWITTNGVAGRLVRGKGDFADRSIFLPAAGDAYGTSLNIGSYHYYWSSTPHSGDSYDAWDLCFTSGSFYRDNYGYHCGSGGRLRVVLA